MASKKHTRQALSLADKKRICELSLEMEKSTHQQVADEFNKTAERSVQRLMVTKTLREKEKWLSMDTSQLNRKRMRGGKFEALEQTLSTYLQEVRAQGGRLSDNLLTAHAERLRAEYHIKEDEFKISNGWVQNFKRRHNIRLNSNTLEEDTSKSNDLAFLKLPSTMEEESETIQVTHLPGIHQLIIEGGFKPVDVFHYDEHYLHYNPDRNPTPKHPASVLLGLMTNAACDTPLLACIHAGPKDATQFQDILYAADYIDRQKHVRMTKEIFAKFVLHINTMMSMQNRRILCFLDPSPCHLISLEGHMSTIYGMQSIELSHILLAFLPPKVAPQMTPLGAGIAKFFHMQYKIANLKWLLSLIDQVPTRRAMKEHAIVCCAQLWKDNSPAVVRMSWHQSGWLPPVWIDDDQETSNNEAESLFSQVQEEWKALYVMYHGVDYEPTTMQWSPAGDGTLSSDVTPNQALESAQQVMQFIDLHPNMFAGTDISALSTIVDRLSDAILEKKSSKYSIISSFDV